MYGGRIEAGICILWWVVKLGRQVYCWMVVIMLNAHIYTHSFMYQIIIYIHIYGSHCTYEYAYIYQKQLHEQILNTYIFRYIYVYCTVHILYTCLCACAFRRPFAHIIITNSTHFIQRQAAHRKAAYTHTHTDTKDYFNMTWLTLSGIYVLRAIYARNGFIWVKQLRAWCAFTPRKWLNINLRLITRSLFNYIVWIYILICMYIVKEPGTVHYTILYTIRRELKYIINVHMKINLFFSYTYDWN